MFNPISTSLFGSTVSLEGGVMTFLMTSSYFVKFSEILMKFSEILMKFGEILMKFKFEITFDVKNYFLLLL